MSVKAEQIEITSPCPITLDRSSIRAQDKAMFCAHCTKDVHLLSQMSEAEARELMREQAGKDICVSYAIRSDGSIRFRTEPSLVPVSALGRRRAPAPVPTPVELAPPRRMSLVATIGASLLLAACTPHGEDQRAGGIEAKPVVEQTDSGEIIPCDSGEPEIEVAGGLEADPLPPPPPPEQLVDGGLMAEPLPPPEPEPEVEQPKPRKDQWQHRRGGVRVRPVEGLDPNDPLAGL